ncbi:MAG: cation:proton antiporter [Methanobacteriaceae archaeon]|nr:cation:proton antiporter [Methanobacteriaceae archaeon]
MEYLALSMAVILLLGLFFSKLSKKINLPGFFGMIILGMVIGPYCLNLINAQLLQSSSDIMVIALVVIIIRAGFGINRKAIKESVFTVLKLGFIPSLIEAIIITILAKIIFNWPVIECFMLGYILTAISPAIIVPHMLDMLKDKLGTDKNIPQIILASCALDDVLVVAIFSAILTIFSSPSGGNVYGLILDIPLSIIFGIIAGLVIAVVVLLLFKELDLDLVEKTIIILAAALLMKSISDIPSLLIPFSGLIGVIVISFFIIDKKKELGVPISAMFDDIWIFVEIFVFVLVGAQVNLSSAINYIPIGLLIIIIGLLARSLGVYFSLWGSDLNNNEKFFCMGSFIPKASVQAAIGSMPLAAGVPSGHIILAITVICILFTSPLGGVVMENLKKKFFENESVT